MNDVSIIVPIYNAARTLSACVDSILSQMVKSFELILVDDGSTDRSGEMCDEYAKVNPNVTIIHKKNGGVSSARNAGIDLSKGEFICFVDSDDSIEPDYLETLLITRRQFPEAGHIWCGFQTVDNQNKLNAMPQLLSDTVEYSQFTKIDYVKLYHKWYTQMPFHRLYRNEIIKNYSIRFADELSLGEDLIFNLDYLDAVDGIIVVANKACYNYTRTNNDSLDHRYRPDLLEIYQRIDKRILKSLKYWQVDEESEQLFWNSVFYQYERVLKNTFHSQNEQSRAEKLAYNNTIMRSAEFKEILKKRNCFVHPLYLRAYESGNYRNVLAVERLVNLKNSITGKK